MDNASFENNYSFIVAKNKAIHMIIENIMIAKQLCKVLAENVNHKTAHRENYRMTDSKLINNYNSSLLNC